MINFHKTAYSRVLEKLFVCAWGRHSKGSTELSPQLLWPLDSHSDLKGPWIGTHIKDKYVERREKFLTGPLSGGDEDNLRDPPTF